MSLDSLIWTTHEKFNLELGARKCCLLYVYDVRPCPVTKETLKNWNIAESFQGVLLFILIVLVIMAH